MGLLILIPIVIGKLIYDSYCGYKANKYAQEHLSEYIYKWNKKWGW